MRRPRAPFSAAIADSADTWAARDRGLGRRGLASLASPAPVPMAAVNNLPDYVLNCPETRVTTLPNGLRVASEVSKK